MCGGLEVTWLACARRGPTRKGPPTNQNVLLSSGSISTCQLPRTGKGRKKREKTHFRALSILHFSAVSNRSETTLVREIFTSLNLNDLSHSQASLAKNPPTKTKLKDELIVAIHNGKSIDFF